jgi:2-C-methyl-D-erythritol 2,4-cyclodiphosphate synthase
VFLCHCAQLLREHHYRLVNADITVLAEAPRLGTHRSQMRANIAADLETTPDRINIKATTSEGLGALGRGEGLAAHAVVLLAHADNGSNGHDHGHFHHRHGR